MVKNPPARAGDMGFIPGLGRSHMQQSKSPCTTTTEAWALTAPLSTKRSHFREKPVHHNQKKKKSTRQQIPSRAIKKEKSGGKKGGRRGQQDTGNGRCNKGRLNSGRVPK